jgi:hypothetical protein
MAADAVLQTETVCCPQAREGNTRMKTGKGGLAQREALLDSHKHRKQSRKRVHTLISAMAHASAGAHKRLLLCALLPSLLLCDAVQTTLAPPRRRTKHFSRQFRTSWMRTLMMNSDVSAIETMEVDPRWLNA